MKKIIKVFFHMAAFILLFTGPLFPQEMELTDEQVINTNNLNHTIEEIMEDEKGRLWFVGLEKQVNNYLNGRELVFGFYDGEEYFYKDIPKLDQYYSSPVVNIVKIDDKIYVFTYTPSLFMEYDIEKDTTKVIYHSDKANIPLTYSLSGDTIFYSASDDDEKISIYQYLSGKSSKLFDIPYEKSDYLIFKRYKGYFFITYAHHSYRYSTDGLKLSEYGIDDFDSLDSSLKPDNRKSKRMYIKDMVIFDDTLIVKSPLYHPSIQFYNPTDDRFYKSNLSFYRLTNYKTYKDRQGTIIIWNDLKNDSQKILLLQENQSQIDLSAKLKSDKRIASLKSHDLSEYFWLLNDDGVFKYKIIKSHENYILKNKSIRYIIPYSSKKLLITTEHSGWYLIDINKHTIQSLSEKMGEVIQFTRGVYFTHDSTIISNNEASIIRVNKDWSYTELTELKNGSIIKSVDLKMKAFRIYSRSLCLKEASKSGAENRVLSSNQKLHLFQALNICVIQLLQF